MSQNVYVKCVQKVKQTEQMEMVEEVYVNSGVVKCHEQPKNTEDGITKTNVETQTKGGDNAGDRCYRLIGVCVLLLCVLLLTAITVVWIKFTNLNAENKQLQTRYNTLTIERDQFKLERDQLQTRYHNLTIERDQLQTRYHNLTIERDQLQTSYNNMTIERDQLQLELNQLETSYNKVTMERDQLQLEINQFETCCKNMTTERDQLELEIDQLETCCNNMTMERDQLEIDQFETCCYDVTIERDQLQLEIDQFETCCNNMTTERDQLEKEKKELVKGLYQLGWSFFNSSLYYISNESKNWTESGVDCRERGSELVIINTMEEQEFISTNFNSTEAWVGLSYSDTESVWKWVDNTILTTAYWLEESPTHYEGYEDCAITTIGSGVFTWNVYPCNYTAFSICEKMIN